jgi:hypothetical protein
MSVVFSGFQLSVTSWLLVYCSLVLFLWNSVSRQCFVKYLHVRTQVQSYSYYSYFSSPVPVAARCKAEVCGRLVAGVACSNPAEGIDVCLLCLYVVFSCVIWKDRFGDVYRMIILRWNVGK